MIIQCVFRHATKRHAKFTSQDKSFTNDNKRYEYKTKYNIPVMIC